MSRVLLAVAIDDWNLGPLAAKEAAVMALEHLGWARVIRVEIEDDEQLSVLGEAKRPPRAVSAPAPPPASAPASAPAPPRPADKPKPQARRQPKPSQPMECCFNCARYCSGPGREASGRSYWGTCGPIGAPVYDLKDRCSAWAPLNRARER